MIRLCCIQGGVDEYSKQNRCGDDDREIVYGQSSGNNARNKYMYIHTYFPDKHSPSTVDENKFEDLYGPCLSLMKSLRTFWKE